MMLIKMNIQEEFIFDINNYKAIDMLITFQLKSFLYYGGNYYLMN